MSWTNGNEVHCPGTYFYIHTSRLPVVPPRADFVESTFVSKLVYMYACVNHTYHWHYLRDNREPGHASDSYGVA